MIPDFNFRKHKAISAMVVLIGTILTGCATAPYQPGVFSAGTLRSQAQTQSALEIEVSAAVPGPSETREIFNLPLYDRGIQPVWLEITNRTDTAIRYAPVGTDPQYFAGQEVAYVHRSGLSKDGLDALSDYFHDMTMPRRIPAGETRSGFVFTHATPGTKGFNVDLFGASEDNDLSFTFFIDVPEFVSDHSDAFFATLYSPEQVQDLSRDALRSALRSRLSLEAAKNPGIPVNGAIVGYGREVLQALVRAGWRERPRSEAELQAETSEFDGRIADVVFTKNERETGEQNVAKFWVSPFREDGVPVWIMQTTHHIGVEGGVLDPDLDEAAVFFLQDVWYGQGLARFAWLQTRPPSTLDAPAQTADGTEYFTSGTILVGWLSGDLVSMLEVDRVGWDEPPARSPSPGMTVPEEDLAFLGRTQTQVEDGVSVTVAVPSAEETREYFGLPLYRRNVQPVWIDVVNNRDVPVHFLPVGLDPWYFTAIESATLAVARKGNEKVRRQFFDQNMVMRIDPGERRRGFVFTQLDQGTKAFNVDIYAVNDEHIGFTFFVPVPGLRLDHQTVEWTTLYDDDKIVNLSRDELIDAVEQMPCCTTDKKGKGSGDPLNLVVIGKPDDVYYAFMRAGWDETEVISAGSLWRMGIAFVARSENRYSPVSGLYLFGRPQDVALQKARDNIDERNHLRLWMSPLRYEGLPVWIGQISRDIGVRLTRKTITTHKVDPDMDETREFLVEDLAYAQALSAIGYLAGVGAASRDEPRGNLTGDPYYTDGLRVVLVVASEPVGFGDIEGLNLRTGPIR